MGKASTVRPRNAAVYLDFEFNQITEERVNLVSCAVFDEKNNIRKKFWLHNRPLAQRRLKKFLKQYEIIIGYACVAEARSFLSLGLNPLDFKWIDLFLEYRMLTNHNDRLQWGAQLVDGKVKHFTKPRPKWERTEEDTREGFKATHSLAEATYKLTKQIRDTKEKDDTRRLIISNPKKFTKEERKQILKYNMDDVVFLPTIWKRIKEEFKEFAIDYPMNDYIQDAFLRGRYSAHTAIMESIGYPINLEATKNFSRQIPSIIAECQRDINSQFEDDLKPFKWVKRTQSFSWNQKVTRKWIEDNCDISTWMKTDGGKKKIPQLALSLEAFERVFQFKHEYPRGNFGAQIVRYLKLKQSLNGFSEGNGKRKTFWDYVGSDGRVRPYMNIYGAQSGRSQPAATGFMFLKPAWMRTLVEPAKGKFIAGVDYGQQEFFLSGLESGDKNMIQAYLSGDPYMYGAKLAGAIPKDGTREEYKIERDLFKNTYLGILYGMTKYGLSHKLTGDLKREFTVDEAQDQIDLFEQTYPDYMAWKEKVLNSYENGCGIILQCGWMIGPDNPNPRSVQNVPIQGLSSSIMRKAVDLAVEKGCKVIFTLHDAIYIEDGAGKESKISKLMEAMKEAFQFYYQDTKYYETAGSIKLDPFAWSPNYKKDSELKVGSELIPCSDLYIDGRAKDEYDKFSIYFEDAGLDLL